MLNILYNLRATQPNSILSHVQCYLFIFQFIHLGLGPWKGGVALLVHPSGISYALFGSSQATPNTFPLVYRYKDSEMRNEK